MLSVTNKQTTTSSFDRLLIRTLRRWFVLSILCQQNGVVVVGFNHYFGTVANNRISSRSAILLIRAQQALEEEKRRKQQQSQLQNSKLFLKTNRIGKIQLFASSRTTSNRRKPSKVIDDAGPTPSLNVDPVEIVDVDEIDELRDKSDPDELPYPIPYQPWRRGETAGCEDPIHAEWRRRAEDIIYKAVDLVGGKVLDVTWYLTVVLITIDDEHMPERDLLKSSGPVIEVTEPKNPLYYDPDDPEPEEIWDDEDDILYIRETEEEAKESKARKQKMYAPYDPELDGPRANNNTNDVLDDDDIPLYKNIETRADIALKVSTDASELHERSEQADFGTIFEHGINVDTAGLSTIARAILDALQIEEETLRVLERHEVMLAGPCLSPEIIETQKQFDAYRNEFIIVQTVDPFQSNRVLKGKLIDRNSMDLIINKQGRMVTIPLNFVQCVQLASAVVAANKNAATGTRNRKRIVYEQQEDDEEEFYDDEEEVEEEYVDDEDYDDSRIPVANNSNKNTNDIDDDDN